MKESVRTYEYAETRLAERKDLEPLIASYRKEVTSIIAEVGILIVEDVHT